MNIPDSISCNLSSRVNALLSGAALLSLCLVSCGGGLRNADPLSRGVSALPAAPAATFYVDCAATAKGDGTEPSPWRTLAAVNSKTFRPGEKILFRRGTTCDGMLKPLGSGTAASPITIDAYGSGPQPIIDGGGNVAAVQLWGVQGWEINNLEVVGGKNYGVNIAGNAPNTAYSHYRLTNLNVHGAQYKSTTANDSGEIFITIGNAGESINDVVIDGVTVHDSKVFDGIYIDAGTPFGTSHPLLGNNITIENSTAYNVYGLGMTLFVVTNGLMENNVVHNTGQCPPHPGCGSGTPGGLMNLYCHACIMQSNESYDIQDWSPWDGGDFDIDVWSDNNIIQYNYGHDSIGYCASVFSANEVAGTDNTIRYNVCANNSRLVDSPDSGEIFLNSGNGTSTGTLNGIKIYNNTFYWNPATPGPAINTVNAVFSGTHPNLIKNNIIYSTVPELVETTSDFELDNNIYWTTGAEPDWNWNGTDYKTLAAYQAASGQDRHSKYADPMLNEPSYHAFSRPVTAFTLLPKSPARGAGADVCEGIAGCSMGERDFWGNPLPKDTGYNIGAWQ